MEEDERTMKRTVDGDATLLAEDQRRQCERFKPEIFAIDTEVTWQLIYVEDEGRGLVYRHQETGRPIAIRCVDALCLLYFQSVDGTITEDNIALVCAGDITQRLIDIDLAYRRDLGCLASLQACDDVEAAFLADIGMNVLDDMGLPAQPQQQQPPQQRRIIKAKRGKRRPNAGNG